MSTIQYSQSKAQFTWEGKTYGNPPSTYSGNGKWKNQSASQCVRNHGPLPRGKYNIGKMLRSHGSLGKHVIPLTPQNNLLICGRSHFYIHGDKIAIALRGTASDGCIVTPFTIRKMIDDNKISELEVVK
jgi:hypothetical protein